MSQITPREQFTKMVSCEESRLQSLESSIFCWEVLSHIPVIGCYLCRWRLYAASIAYVWLRRSTAFAGSVTDLSPSSRRKLLYTSLSHLNQILVPQLWQSFEGGTWLLQVTIGASMSRQACKTNPVQLSHSLIKTICYPNIFKISNDATEHGCKHEKEALAAYELTTKKRQVNFKVEECGLFVNLQYPLVACHARFPLQLWLLRWGVWWD